MATIVQFALHPMYQPIVRYNTNLVQAKNSLRKAKGVIEASQASMFVLPVNA